MSNEEVEKIRQPFHNALGRMDAYLKRLNAEWVRTPDSDTGEAQLAVARLMAASVCVEMLEEALEEVTK